jgi:hypothetical protein
MTLYAVIDQDGYYTGTQIQSSADNSPGVDLSTYPLPSKPDGAKFDREKQQWGNGSAQTPAPTSTPATPAPPNPPAINLPAPTPKIV